MRELTTSPSSSSAWARKQGGGTLAALAAIAVAASAGVVALCLSEVPGDKGWLVALGQGISVFAPTAIALLVLRHRPYRFALALYASGLLWSLAALSESHISFLYSVGRIAGWLAAPAAVYLLLSFPFGRLPGRFERRLVLFVAALTGVLYVLTALVVDQFPVPIPMASCGVHCPPNFFQITHHEPAIVADVIKPLRQVLSGIALLVPGFLLLARNRARDPMRRIMTPVVIVAFAYGLSYAAFIAAREFDGVGGLATALGWVYQLALPAIAIALGLGVIEARMYAADALRRLALAVPDHANADRVRAGMAEALDDRELRFAISDGDGRWHDEYGHDVGVPRPVPGRAVTVVPARDKMVAVDHLQLRGLAPALLEVAAAYAVAVIENERLVTELRESLFDLSESRARIVTVADHTRAQIGRDLHDGAQQSLVVLRVRLSAEAERVRAAHPGIADELEELGDEVEHTIDDVRSLARGIYPPTLAGFGLAEALRWLAIEGDTMTTFNGGGVGRYAPDIEAAVYFAVLEAVQNVAKHASDAAHLSVELIDDGYLRFEVRDDGPGFALAGRRLGAGLTNIRDRIGAVGGDVSIRSAVGEGTSVSGWVPAGASREPAPTPDPVAATMP